MAGLLELAARCERAKGPVRELDALLHCVREELEFVMLSKGGEVYGEICDPDDSGYGGQNTCTPGMLYARYPDHKNPPTLGGGQRGNKVQGCHAGAFTASFDSAMTLVPEGWRLSRMEEDLRSGRWHGQLAQRASATLLAALDKGRTIGWVTVDTEEQGAATPALALCVAALRARSAQ